MCARTQEAPYGAQCLDAAQKTTELETALVRALEAKDAANADLQSRSAKLQSITQDFRFFHRLVCQTDTESCVVSFQSCER